jgi:hypothetical protein
MLLAGQVRRLHEAADKLMRISRQLTAADVSPEMAAAQIRHIAEEVEQASTAVKQVARNMSP